MIGNSVFKTEPAKPAVSKMQLYLLAQSSLTADAVAVAYNQHPDHQLGVNRGAAEVTVKRRECCAQIIQHPRHNRIDPAQEMVGWNHLFEIEKVEKLALINCLPPHH